MNRFKNYDATGVAPNGRLFAGDMNQFQDLVAALVDLAQAVSVGTITIGESGLIVSRFGAGEAQLAGRLRTTGYIRAAGGIYPGEFTTANRDAIVSGQRPGRLIVWNTTTGRFEYNAGTDAAPNWQPLAPSLAAGTITTTEIADLTILAGDIANLQPLGAKIADNEILNRHLADAIVTAAEIAASLKPSGTAGTGTEALRALGTGAGQAAAGSHAAQHASGGADPLGAASVSSAMLRNSGALTVIGRSANSVGVPGDIAATPGSNDVLRESGSAVGFGKIVTGSLSANTACILGTFASRPAANSVPAGVKFVATDQNFSEYVSDGAAWQFLSQRDVCSYQDSRTSGQTFTATAPSAGTYIVAFGIGKFDDGGQGSNGTLSTNVTGTAVAQAATVSGDGGSVHFPGVALTAGQVVTATASVSSGTLRYCWLHLIRVA